MTNKVEIAQDHLLSKSCIKFTFHGKFTTEVCHQAVVDFNKKFQNSPAPFNFLWDCTPMAGFDLAARKEWITFLQSLEGKLGKVNVISDNIVTRGSARLLLKLFGLEGEVYKNYEEILQDKKGVNLNAA